MAADTMNSKRSAENENVLKVAKNKQGEPITIQIGKTYSIKVVSVENGQCDQCGERGPAKYETDEDDPDNPFPPLIYNAPSSLEKKRQKRPAVGMAQQLLNDFIVWLRLGGWKLTPGSYDSVAAYLNELPELIKVDCWFGKNTETATKLFQSWHGNLKVDGKIGPKTWKELILFSDAYSLLYDKSYPEPRTPPDAPDLYAVPGLGSPDDSPVLLASNDPLFLPVADSGTAKVCCAKMYSKAKNFSELVQLVKDAEVLLESSGVSDCNDRLRAIRGIYYGTIWSADYKKEKSMVRNTGFNIYASGMWGSVSMPLDPRNALACNLFQALQISQDVTDANRHIDFGHLIIGVEARECGQTGNITGFDHSGLEAATWIGDLGGGAAMLANSRVARPSTRARTRFTGTNFGGSINLEGDVSAYVTGMNTTITNKPAPPVFSSSSTTPLGDVLEDYLQPGTSIGGPLWQNRSKNFLSMLGGSFTGKTLANRSTLVTAVQGKIEEFGCYYLTNRLRQQGKLTSKALRDASEYLPGAAQEVAEIFIDALQHNVKNPDQKIRAVTDPAPTGKGSIPPRCSIGVSGTEVIEKGRDIINKKLQEILDILP